MLFNELIANAMTNPESAIFHCSIGDEYKHPYSAKSIYITIIPNKYFKNELSCIEVEEYHYHEICTSSGIPAAGGGWHKVPSYAPREDKKPAYKYTISVEQMEALVKRNFKEECDAYTTNLLNGSVKAWYKLESACINKYNEAATRYTNEKAIEICQKHAKEELEEFFYHLLLKNGKIKDLYYLKEGNYERYL